MTGSIMISPPPARVFGSHRSRIIRFETPIWGAASPIPVVADSVALSSAAKPLESSDTPSKASLTARRTSAGNRTIGLGSLIFAMLDSLHRGLYHTIAP
ncbi:hypothetical protein D3C71_1741140 [compost metagenome]